MSEEIFDFGFTLVDEDELDTVQEIEQKVSESSTTAEQTQDKLDKLFSAIFLYVLIQNSFMRKAI